jgi:hypothetical protein
MNDTYDAGYLPDDADCDQDSIRVELAYSHDFYTAIIEGQEERIAELEDLAQMIIDADSADERLRPMMHHVWLCKAQRLLGSSK